jgi:hypothetical protein
MQLKLRQEVMNAAMFFGGLSETGLATIFGGGRLKCRVG